MDEVIHNFELVMMLMDGRVVADLRLYDIGEYRSCLALCLHDSIQGRRLLLQDAK